MRTFPNNLLFLCIILMGLISCNGGGEDQEKIKLIPVVMGLEYQYIDQEGKIIINPQFTNASIFYSGSAVVQTSGSGNKWGFIDEKGKYIFPAVYKQVSIFKDGLAWVVNENASPNAINEKGDIIFNLPVAEHVRSFQEGYAAFSQLSADKVNEKWGFVDKSGKISVNPQFSNVENFSDGKCAVSNEEGEWGYIDKSGNLIIPYQFNNAQSFHNGKAIVRSLAKVGVITSDGKYFINPQFQNMVYDDDRYLINQDGKFGWTDKDGKIIINPQFNNAYPFSGSALAPVQSGNNWGYIDKDGKIAINPQFEYALPFNYKMALVVSGGKFGFINLDGKYVINPQFGDVSRDLLVYLSTRKSLFIEVISDNSPRMIMLEEKRISDSIIVADSLTVVMAQAENRRRADSIEIARQYSRFSVNAGNKNQDLKSSVSDQDIQFYAQAEAVVPVGEKFTLTYTLNTQGSNFRGPNIQGINILSGPNTSTKSSIRMVNGSNRMLIIYTYTYLLEAPSDGIFNIPAATVSANGKQFISNTLSIKVVKSN